MNQKDGLDNKDVRKCLKKEKEYWIIKKKYKAFYIDFFLIKAIVVKKVVALTIVYFNNPF